MEPPIGDIGGAFDYSNLSTTGHRRPRGLPRSQQRALRLGCGFRRRECEHARAAAQPFRSLFYEGDAGTFTTFRNRAQLGGTYKNSITTAALTPSRATTRIKLDEFHDDTASANLGYAFTSATQIRVTASNSDAATGTPGPFNFYGIANAGKQSNQDTYLGASIENRTYGNWHNLVRYGMTRKREEDINFYPAGIPSSLHSRTTITVTIP